MFGICTKNVKSTKNQLSNFGQIEETMDLLLDSMDLSCILLAVPSFNS